MRRWRRGKGRGGWGAGLAACALAAFTAVATAHPAWKIQNSPNATVPGGRLSSVSCSSAGACTAVGANVSTSGLNVTLAERWNGTSWQRQRTPSLAGTVPARFPGLLGVSCPASDFCEAVGSYQVGTTGISLAEGWNGRAWTRQLFPVPAGSTSAGLDQVSCTSALFCEAVGSYANGAGENLALAAQWNGTSWRLQRAPHPAGATLVRLTGVSCVSPKFCEAGGNAAGAGAFAERWNGTAWHLQAVPGTAGVRSVSCVSVTFCEMVGSGGGDVWNGSSWSSQAIPSPAGATFASLSGVSCVTAAFCEAVGQYSDSSGNTFTLGATWNGTSWALQTTPSRAGASFTSLNAVSCAAVAACEAGGDFQLSSSGPLVALAESWSGTSWRIRRVSCVSTQFCEAVGNGPNGMSAEVWNGSSWKVQNRPGPGGVQGQFVSCASVDFCLSVDAFARVDTWNGSSWSAGPSVPGFSPVSSVSCVSATFCEVVGGGPSGESAAVWNGGTWTAQPTPGGVGEDLTAVWCLTASSCEAVGELVNQGNPLTLAEAWNGSTWTVQPTPNPSAAAGSTLNSVSCTSASACTAVGQYQYSAFGPFRTLAEVWNGKTWSLRPTPNHSAGQNILSGVSCGASHVCTAVGQTQDVGLVEATLIESGD